MKTYLVTGGAGFIGSYVIDEILKQPDVFVYNVDKMGVGSNIDNLHHNDTRVKNVFADLRDKLYNYSIDNKIDYIVHLAAESHVDRSIKDPSNFLENNVYGTFNVLETCKKHKARMVHVSTDEVYGHLLEGEPAFTEEHPLKPRSPYSASKASSDLLVQSYVSTYNIDASITRCCNNYGPRQHYEKLIPYIAKDIVREAPICIYGDGSNIREWIHAQDHARAILEVLDIGNKGEVYNIPGSKLISNLELVQEIFEYVKAEYPRYNPSYRFVRDRQGHDFKYEIVSKHKLNAVENQREFDFRPTIDYYIRKYTS